MNDDSKPGAWRGASLTLTAIAVGLAGLYSAYCIAAGLLTGEIPAPAKAGRSSFFWGANPGYFLAALTFYSVVVAAAIYGVGRLLWRRPAA